jgi:hypothetical protein
VVIGFVAAEPIVAFTNARLADISTSVATKSGVDPSQVTTVAYAASTPGQLVSRALSEVLASNANSSEGAVGAARVEITIVTPDSSANAAAEESLSASVFADANATSAFLNLQVTSAPDVAAETVTYQDEEGDAQENVSLMLGGALVDTVISLGAIFGLITAIHYAILFWWYMYANRKYYAYHEALRAQDAAEEAVKFKKEASTVIEDAKAKKKAEAEEAAKTLSDVESMINALENDADLEQAVEAAGGVKSLIDMAAKHSDSALVQAQFAGVLRDLCISDDIAIEIANAGGTDALIEAARIHYDSIEVQAAVAGAMRNLSELDQIAVDIATAGGIEVRLVQPLPSLDCL